MDTEGADLWRRMTLAVSSGLKVAGVLEDKVRTTDPQEGGGHRMGRCNLGAGFAFGRCRFGNR
ncbi:hypothetical protein [Nocardiopsis valliformis]|uniref:hypothetical protein n=1 Tax=Nocardiopsis valliformis TaxID=239974 RepID=UPI00034C51DB|nr:hypothetical protein [Nocardiopsis valliformis]